MGGNSDSERLDWLGKFLGCRDIRKSCDVRMSASGLPVRAREGAAGAGKSGAGQARSPTRKPATAGT
jgi:hypothetical protein